MIHTPLIIDRGPKADHVYVIVRCCNDPSTDQSHSLLIGPLTDAATIQTWANGIKAAVAAQHAAMLDALSTLQSLT